MHMSLPAFIPIRTGSKLGDWDTSKSLPAILEATRAMLLDPRLESVLPALLQLARQFIAADAQAIWRFDQQDQRWTVLASAGLSASYATQFVPAGQVPEQPLIISNMAALPPHLEWRRAHYQAEGIQALIVSPYRLRSGIGGTMAFYYREPHRPSEIELQWLDVLSNMAALAVETAEAHDTQKRDSRRAQFLAEASTILASSLEYQQILAGLARVAVPHIADWCAIHLQEEDGSIQRMAVEHIDAAKVEFAREMQRRYPPTPDGAIARVLRSGNSEIYLNVTDDMLESNARDPEHLKLLQQVGMRSAILAPLRARDNTLGVITLVMAESGRRFSRADLPFVEDVARRAGIAVDNARLYGALQMSEQRLKMSHTAAGAWSWELDLDSGRMFRTKKLQEIWNSAPPGLAIDTFSDLLSNVHPEDRQRLQDNVERALRDPAHEHEFEYRVVVPGGGTRWMYSRGRLMSSGRRRVLSGIAMDITTRKEAELATAAVRARMQMAQAIAGIAIWDRVFSTGEIAWSEGSAELYGYPLENMRSFEAWLNCIHPEDREKVEAAHQLASLGERDYEAEFRVVWPDGSVRWLLSKGRVVKNTRGVPERIVGISMDITVRKVAEDALRQSEERMRFSLEAANFGTWEWNIATGQVRWSDNMERVHHQRPGSFTGKFDSFLQTIHPEDRDRVLAAINDSIKKDAKYHAEYRNIGQDGEVVWLEAQGRVIREDGQPKRMMGVCMDVTARKQMLEALLRAHDEMEDLVQQRTVALRRLSSRLLRLQDDERRRIARELHDSVGQYLTSLKINLSLLERGQTDGALGKTKAGLFSESLTTVEQCLKEIRTLSHLLHPPLLDEAGFSSAARWYVDGFAQRSGIRIEFDIPPELGRFPQVVEIALFRVLQETLNNVHRHSGSLAADIRLEYDAESVTLEVRDYGRGIRPEVLNRFREAGTDVGVGLAGMRERINELGGLMEITASEGGGTSVSVTIPLNTEDWMRATESARKGA